MTVDVDDEVGSVLFTVMINPQAADGVKKLVQVFVDKGYALKSSVEPVQFAPNQPGGKLRVSFQLSSTCCRCLPNSCHKLDYIEFIILF